MFENFTFDQKGDSTILAVDDDPPLSPRQSADSTNRPRQEQSPCSFPLIQPLDEQQPQTSPPVLGGNIDILTHELSKQSLESFALLGSRPAEPSLQTTSSSTTSQVPLEPAPLVPDSRIQPTLPSRPSSRVHDQPQQSQLTIPTQPTVESSELHQLAGNCQHGRDNAREPRELPTDLSRLRRELHTQPTSHPLSSRTIQNLMEDMISSGTQCNVYDSLPLTPTSSTPLPEHNNYIPAAPIEIDDGVDLQMGGMALEIDSINNGPDDDDSLAIEAFSFRRAATAGIGRARFRGPTETAVQSGRLVRNKPRMRKRKTLSHKPSKATSLASIAGSSPTASTTASIAGH